MNPASHKPTARRTPAGRGALRIPLALPRAGGMETKPLERGWRQLRTCRARGARRQQISTAVGGDGRRRWARTTRSLRARDRRSCLPFGTHAIRRVDPRESYRGGWATPTLPRLRSTSRTSRAQTPPGDSARPSPTGALPKAAAPIRVGGRGDRPAGAAPGERAPVAPDGLGALAGSVVATTRAINGGVLPIGG
jgi:hypothetical protein